MVSRVSIRAKGQMTLPAHARKKLGINDSGEVFLRETEDGFELVSTDKISDIAAGALAKYARTRNPEPAEERAWVARRIAETDDDYE